MFPEKKYPALEAAGKAYWSKKLYEEDYREFKDWFVPECNSLMKELCDVNPRALGHSELVEHVTRCFDLAAEFWKVCIDSVFTAVWLPTNEHLPRLTLTSVL